MRLLGVGAAGASLPVPHRVSSAWSIPTAMQPLRLPSVSASALVTMPWSPPGSSMLLPPVPTSPVSCASDRDENTTVVLEPPEGIL